MNIPERRNYKRLDIELPVTLHVDGTKFATETVNVGGGGIFASPVPEGIGDAHMVTVQLILPDSQREVRLKGAILRVEADERDGIAIEFVGLPTSDHLAIQRFIKNALN